MEESLPVIFTVLFVPLNLREDNVPPGPPKINVDVFRNDTPEWKKVCQLWAMPSVSTTLRLGGAGGYITQQLLQ